MVRLRIVNGSGRKALMCHRNKWCRGMVNGLKCGARSFEDESVRVFCNGRCAATFRRYLTQTEPTASTVPA